jgi:hypothetical protein
MFRRNSLHPSQKTAIFIPPPHLHNVMFHNFNIIYNSVFQVLSSTTFRSKILYAFLISHLHLTYAASIIILCLIILIIDLQGTYLPNQVSHIQNKL